MALLVKVDGTTEEVEVPTEGRLKFLQKTVGGYIEFAPCKNPSYSEYAGLICDEEGKMKRKAVNDRATVMSGLLPYDCICGDALFFKEGEVD